MTNKQILYKPFQGVNKPQFSCVFLLLGSLTGTLTRRLSKRQPLHLLLQLRNTILPKPRHFANITQRDLIQRVIPHLPLPRNRAGRHRKPHIPWPVHQFQDRARRLIIFLGFNAENARVSTGAIGVALAEGAEELGDEFVGGLIITNFH